MVSLSISVLYLLYLLFHLIYILNRSDSINMESLTKTLADGDKNVVND